MPSFSSSRIGKPRRSLGSILRSARNRAQLTLDQAEDKTRVPIKYLSALEDGRYELLPAEAYNIGFVRSYAQLLHLNEEKIIRLYREERANQRVGSTRNKEAFAPRRMGDWQFLITPKLLGVLGTILLLGSVVAYIGVEVDRFAQPPELAVTNVPAEFTSSKDSIKLVGITTAGATMAINSQPISVSPDGSFSQEIQLSPGINDITLTAKNRLDKETRRSVTVLYNPNLASVNQNGTTE